MVHTEPVVHPKVRKKIPDEHVLESIGLAESDQDGYGDGNAEITQKNEFGILGFIQRACWVEVVDAGEIAIDLALSTTFDLTLVVVVASNVGKEVHGPSEKLLAKGVEESRDRGFIGQLIEFVDKLSNTTGIHFTSLGEENHVTLHVPGGLVVLAVGNLPGEIWDEESRVADPTSSVIENL